MASAYINVYQGNPTEGGTDGTVVSTADNFDAPLNFDLDAENNEVKTLKLAIRTEPGYKVTNCTITDLNDINDRITVCKTEDGEFTNSIVFDEITDVNTIFYIKASSTSTEPPQTDKSIKLRYYGTIQKVV